jgi:hypothetical protein
MTALANGETLPAIVSAKASSKANARQITVDGNHRLMAHIRKNRLKIAVYEIRGASQAAVISATMEANTRHGMALSEPDRFHHAMWYLDNGMDLKEVARRTGLSASSIRRAGKLAEATKRADEVGILRTTWESLNPYVRERLASVATDDAFAPLAMLALDADLTTSEVNRLATAVNGIRSAAAQVKFIERARTTEFAEAISEKGLRKAPKRGGQRTPRQHINMVLGNIEVLPSPDAILSTITPEEALAMGERLDGAMSILEKISQALAERSEG